MTVQLLWFLLLLAYPWPLAPQNQQHWVSGTFCEYRDGPPPHFHDAVDIPAPEGTEVYASAGGTVLWIQRTGYSSGIRVGRFAYVHTVPRPDLDLGDLVNPGELIATINPYNHVHFKDGGGASGLPNINPLLPENLQPFQDSLLPAVLEIRLYRDRSQLPFGDTVSGLVDFVARAYDTTDTRYTGVNNGLYRVGYAVYAADSSPVIPPTVTMQFDTKPDNAYLGNVYAPGSNTSTYFYIATNAITANGFWDTRDLPPGPYQVEVFGEDTRNNRNGLTRWVYVVPPDTTPPDPPTLLTFQVDSAGFGVLRFRPSPSSDLQGHRLYLRFAESDWVLWADETEIGAADTLYRFDTPFPEGWIFEVRLTAVDQAYPPNESPPTPVLAAQRMSRRSPLLLIGGDPAPASPVVGEMAHALGENCCFLTSAIPEGARTLPLSAYRAVLLGGGAADTLPAFLRDTLRTYHLRGGRLLFQGKNLARGLNRDDPAFLEEVFGLRFLEDSTRSDSLFFPEPIGPLSARLLRPGSDVLTPLSADPLAYYGDGGLAGGGTERTVFFGFSLEDVDSLARGPVLQGAVAYLGAVDVAEGPKGLPPSKGHLRIFPNPAWRTAVLEGNALAEVYDRSGRRIYRLRVRGRLLLGGSHYPLPAGLYFIRTPEGERYKVVLLKP